MFVFDKYYCALCGKHHKQESSAMLCCKAEIHDQILDHYSDNSRYCYGNIASSAEQVITDSVEAANFSEKISEKQKEDCIEKTINLISILLK